MTACPLQSASNNTATHPLRPPPHAGWDFYVPLVPFINVPPNDGFDTHECTRRAPTTQSQMAKFFFTGQIVNTCGGPCLYPNWTQNC